MWVFSLLLDFIKSLINFNKPSSICRNTQLAKYKKSLMNFKAGNYVQHRELVDWTSKGGKFCFFWMLSIVAVSRVRNSQITPNYNTLFLLFLQKLKVKV